MHRSVLPSRKAKVQRSEGEAVLRWKLVVPDVNPPMYHRAPENVLPLV
uniref:Uncharacterized protein n=1 Tax=Coprothermobacter proteolyticus (strain ATCC 35245 / DSM 5265 / OCM 4 / BT) TaxID=309798 RepID=B5Y6T9_COPPD